MAIYGASANELALIEAARKGETKRIQELITLGVNVNCSNAYNITPLIAAAQAGELEAVKLLMMNKAAPYHRDGNGKDPVMYAAEKGHLNVVKYILENSTLKDSILDIPDYSKRTALMYAAREGHHEVVKFLLTKKSARIDGFDNDGYTPLMHAAAGNHLKAAIYLVQKGANIDHFSNTGETAISLAEKHPNKYLANYLKHNQKPPQISIPIYTSGIIKTDDPDRILVHQLDHEASSSKFEGSNISQISNWMMQAIQRLQNNKLGIPLPKGLAESVTNSRLLDRYAEIQMWDKEITWIQLLRLHHDVNEDEDTIPWYTSKMAKHFETNKRIYLPGGWAGTPSGHAMVYELRIEGNNVILEIYNTGAGISHHAMEESATAKRYEPVLAYRFPNIMNDPTKKDKFMKDLLGKLIEPQVLPVWDQGNPQKKYDASRVYGDINKIVKDYDGIRTVVPGLTRVDSTKGITIKPQRAGICASKSMWAYAKKVLSPEDYKLFKLYTKYMDLQDYANEPDKLNASQIKMAKFLLQNIARACHKYLKANIIDQDQFNIIFNNLTKIEHTLEQRSSALKKAESVLRSGYKPEVRQENSYSMKGFYDSLKQTPPLVVKKVEEWSKPDLKGKSSFETLTNLMDYLNRLQKEGDALPLQICDVIEEVVENHLKLDEDQFIGLNEAQAEQLFKNIARIMHEYNVAIAKQERLPIPKRLMTAAKLTTLGYWATNQYFTRAINIQMTPNSGLQQKLAQNYISTMGTFFEQSKVHNFILLSEKSSDDFVKIKKIHEGAKKLALAGAVVQNPGILYTKEEDNIFHEITRYFPKVKEVLLKQREQDKQDLNEQYKLWGWIGTTVLPLSKNIQLVLQFIRTLNLIVSSKENRNGMEYQKTLKNLKKNLLIVCMLMKCFMREVLTLQV